MFGGLNISDERREGESDRKQVGRIMVACLGAKLIGETLQRRTVGVHHAKKEKTTGRFIFQHFYLKKQTGIKLDLLPALRYIIFIEHNQTDRYLT